MSKLRNNVLIVFANPRNTNPLRLGTEERVIRQSIRLSRYRDNISLTTCHATTIHDLRRALLDEEFQIVHISGHGSDTGLVLEDELGGRYIVPQQALADLFQAYTPPIRCVILNACYSISQGQLISFGVPLTIAMEGSISDKAAVEFARGFYDAIGAGREIDFAYEEGCRTVKLAAPNTQFISKILKRGEAHPLQVIDWKQKDHLIRTAVTEVNDDRGMVRFAAAQKLAVLKDRSTVSILARRLGVEPDPTVRYWLAYALGQIGGEEACTSLQIAEMQETHPFARQGIAEGLWAAGCKKHGGRFLVTDTR